MALDDSNPAYQEGLEFGRSLPKPGAGAHPISVDYRSGLATYMYVAGIEAGRRGYLPSAGNSALYFADGVRAAWGEAGGDEDS